MPAPLVGGVLWVIGSLLGTMVTSLFGFLFRFIAVKWAWRVTIGAAYVLAASVVTVAASLAVKALIVGARVGMPSSLGASTYFLPSNINVIIGVYITVRVSVFVWQWTLKNMERFFQANP